MSWCSIKWWRFALSSNRCGTTYDVDGRWRHLVGSLWWLAERGAYPEVSRVQGIGVGVQEGSRLHSVSCAKFFGGSCDCRPEKVS